MQDQRQLYDQHYGIHLKNDPDYSGALLQANPHHAPLLQQLFPTGEMFQPLARFLLKVGCPPGDALHQAQGFPAVQPEVA
jgi:hypothetical protein